MTRWRISKGQAVDLQEWALEESGVREFLRSLPELPKSGRIKPGIYVSYEIDEMELDGGIDWPDVGVATVFAVLKNGRKKCLGEVRAYNWEAIWLSTREYDEVGDAEEWWKYVKEDHEKLRKSGAMSLYRGLKKEKKIQVEDFSLEKKLQSLNNKDMYDLVKTVMGEKPEIRRLILEWFKDSQKARRKRTHDEVREL